MSVWRMLRALAGVAVGWATVTFLPDLARYLRMREMSRARRSG